LEFDVEIISKKLITYKYFSYYLKIDENDKSFSKIYETINSIIEKDRKELK
jgi:hypothetical protein